MDATHSPLETFFRAYVDSCDGLWDEVEPQVYDVLWSASAEPQRVTFDAEALPEHPSAHLLTFGLPLLDDLLADAQQRGQVAHAVLDGLHLDPYGLESQVERDLVLPDATRLEVAQVRPRYVLHTRFWFEATLVSDEKEQTLVTAAVDRCYGRLVRHLDTLTREDLSETRLWPHPDAPAIPLDQAYHLARERVVRTVAVAANSHHRERQERMQTQVARMAQYFDDMRTEVQERIQKAQAREEPTETLHERLTALERERTVRIEELRRKAVTRVQVRLTSLLHLSIPRLFLRTRLVPSGKRQRMPDLALTITWDPLLGKTDAVDCPTCGTPTYDLRVSERGAVGCPTCLPEG